MFYLAGGIEITVFENFFNPSINNSLLLIGLLIISFLILGRGIKKLKPNEAPKGIYLVLEMVVQFVNRFTEENMGKYWRIYAPYILTLGLYLSFANMWGLFGLRPPTSSVNVTFSLSIITFIVIHVSGIASRGFIAWGKGFFEPLAFMFPMNIIGELAVPLSLGLRLFGNIFSSLILTGLIYGALGWVAPLVTPVFHAIFDMFFGLIQMVVFVMLTTIFVSGQLDLEEN